MEHDVVAAESSPVNEQSKSQNPRFILIIQVLVIVISGLAPGFLPYSSRTDAAAFIFLYAAALVVPSVMILGIGYLTDAHGRKTMLMVCEIILAITVFFPLLEMVLRQDFGLLARIIPYIESSVMVSIVIVLQAMASDFTPTQNRTRIFGLLLALSGSTLLWFLLLEYADIFLPFMYRAKPFVVLALFAIVIYLTKVKLHDNFSRESQPQPRLKQRAMLFLKTLFRPKILILLILITAQAAFILVLRGNLSLFKLSRTGQWYGQQELVPDLVIVIVQIAFIGKLSRWLGDRRLVYLGLILLLVGMALFILTPTQAVPGYVKEDMTRIATVDDYTHRDGKTTSVPLPPDEHNGWDALVWFYIATITASTGAGLLVPPLFSLLTRETRNTDWGKLLGISRVLTFLVTTYVPRPILRVTVMDNPALPFIISAGVFLGLLALAIFALPHIAPDQDVNFAEA